ncbi:NAD-dependent epimerase/dehydratase family protein, partial [Lysinibacillus sp. D3C2_S12]|uniref:NAD-dependent epimerase/dehydratase family protein n=1 Tax=Lysinibacillus sp. D3C2_S12 TaxID=2941226 RepID=UPI0020BFE192
TRFFGKKLVELCMENGHDVTTLTRGQSGNPFGPNVKQLVANRNDQEALAQVLSDKTWDIVYDDICYSPKEAQAICE